MEEQAPFRSVEAAPSEPVTPTETSEQPIAGFKPSDVAETLGVYEEVNGKPYTADFFQLGPFLEDNSFSGTHLDVRMFEDFVRNEIQSKGLERTPAAYQEVVAELEKMIGSYENEQPQERFRRLATAAKALARLRSVSKKPMLSGENLTTAEYEGIFGLGVF